MAEESDGGFQSMEPHELFTYFTEKASDVSPIFESFQMLKKKLGVQDKTGLSLYNSLKSKLTNWKAKSLWALLDKKVSETIDRTDAHTHTDTV